MKNINLWLGIVSVQYVMIRTYHLAAVWHLSGTSNAHTRLVMHLTLQPWEDAFITWLVKVRELMPSCAHACFPNSVSKWIAKKSKIQNVCYMVKIAKDMLDPVLERVDFLLMCWWHVICWSNKWKNQAKWKSNLFNSPSFGCRDT